MSLRRQSRWTNWSGSATVNPRQVVAPTSREEMARLVADAAESASRVKAVGSGHSFTAIAAARDVQVRLDDYQPQPTFDEATGDVTVSAGMPLSQLNALLARRGRALPNLGDIDVQTLAGATATGTHGTGARLGGLSTFITGLRLIDGTGTQHQIDRDDPRLGAAALGLGALGIVTDITVRTVEAFRLGAVEQPMTVERVSEDFHGMGEDNDHIEFYWFPGAEQVLVKRHNRGVKGEPLPPVRRWIDNELMSNTVFGAACRLARVFPAATGTVNAVSARGMARRVFTDDSHRVLCTPRRVRFVEMEYALPAEAFASAFERLREVVARHRVAFPVEVRLAAADELWLSTAHHRPSVYFAVHQYQGMPYRDYFDEIEAVMRDHDGRPHWGKLHRRTAADLEPVYPRFAEFQRLRDTLDPRRVFANPYLDRVLGP